MNKDFPYSDILHLPHHVSPTRAKMSMVERAAQFAPFAALTGYDAAIRETARLTGQRVELTEGAKAELDQRFQTLQEHRMESPWICVTCFAEDLRKEGGSYLSVEGCFKKIDPVSQVLLFANGQRIPLADITDIQSDLFSTEFFQKDGCFPETDMV